MVRVYRGKLDWFHYAVNETFTLIFPENFEVGQRVYATWQWTVDAGGTEKPNTFHQGHINTNAVVDGKRTIGFHYENYYSFTATISEDEKSITYIMKKPTGATSPESTVKEVLHDSSETKYLIYTGKYNESSYAVNELMILLVAPNFSYNNNVGVFWQWSKDYKDEAKVPQTYVGKITRFEEDAQGAKAQFIADEHYYKFAIERPGDQTKEVQIKVSSYAAGLPNESPHCLTLAVSDQ